MLEIPSHGIPASLTSGMKMRNLGFVCLVSGLALVQNSPFLLVGMVMCILCHRLLEVHDRHLAFDPIRDYRKKLPLVSEKTLTVKQYFLDC